MAVTKGLPEPDVNARLFGARRIPALTDDGLFEAVGVRIAFSGREGGVSDPPYDSLNLGSHVGDDPSRVRENRLMLLESLDAADASLVVPSQVHGDVLIDLTSGDADSVSSSRTRAEAGADGLVVTVPQVAALLCFADCVPVIIVSPTGRFAVVHAGWRGAVGGIAGKAARRLTLLDGDGATQGAASSYNAYLGPHIHGECFETGEDVRARFVERFGRDVAPDGRHVDLAAAVGQDLAEAGLRRERIADVNVCTSCEAEDYFSYRASGGRCGRQGALAVRFGR